MIIQSQNKESTYIDEQETISTSELKVFMANPYGNN